MCELAKDKRCIFLGQAVAYPGTAMSVTLAEVPRGQLLELPVEEEFQLGFSIGLALSGLIPISIFPRWNFLLLAMNQLANHLDKLQEVTGVNSTKVIIRTSVGSQRPLHPGPQHIGNYTQAAAQICPNIDFVELTDKNMIVPAYKKALSRKDGKSTVLVEWGDYHNEK